MELNKIIDNSILIFKDEMIRMTEDNDDELRKLTIKN